MAKYIIETRSTWTERNLVEADSVGEAFQQSVDGEILRGEGEQIDDPILLTSIKITDDNNIEEYFQHPSMEELVKEIEEEKQNANL